MKKTMRKIGLGGSIVALIVCLVLVTGSTFSLFTTKDENDITVNAAKVELTAKIDTTSLALYSKGVVQTEKFENDGTATFTNNDKSLLLDQVTPGDKAEFNIVVTNASTVDIQYRIKWTYDGELADVLVTSVDGVALTSGTSEWAKWTPDEDDTKTLKLSVELPITVNDDYQEDSATIDFYIEAVQANGTAEYDPTAFVNTAAGLQAAIDSGATNIVLNESIDLNAPITIGEAANENARKSARRFADNVAEADDTITIDLNGYTLKSNVTDGAAIVNNSDVVITNGAITAASGIAFENKATATLDEVTLTGAVASTGADAVLTLDNSSIAVSGETPAIFATEGGAVVVNGGTYANENGAVISGNVTVNDGEYKGAVEGTENNAPNLAGGNFDAMVNEDYVNDGLTVLDNGDGTYTVIPTLEGVTLTNVFGYPHLFTDGTDYYAYTATGLISMRNFWAANCYGNNMWGRSYNVMADIDATGYTWDNVWVVVGYNGNNGFVFDGNGHTITGLTINGGMFSGTPNGGDKPENPGYFKNITFDGVKAVGDHFTGILWSNMYNELVVENVTVINSEITGKCNVAALVGGTVIETSTDASVKFINCTVKDNVITAEGKDGQDPNGANVFLSRAYGMTYVTFENCVSENNTLTNENGLVGGGIYGYTVYVGGWAGTGTCNEFANWGGLVSNVSGLGDLKNGGDVVLGTDLTFNASETTDNSGYGATGLSVKGGVLDGNGQTVTVNGANGTWDSAVHTNGGTIKNLTVNGAFRGIFTGGLDSDLYIDNVIIDKVCYTFNADSTDADTYSVIVTNSTINGWTSYSNCFKLVTFTDCNFGKGTGSYGYAFCRPYNATVFENCVFEEGFEFDTSKVEGLVFINCYYGDTLITAENAATIGNGETTFFYNGLNGATIQ